jgi:hypothetical protein
MAQSSGHRPEHEAPPAPRPTAAAPPPAPAGETRAERAAREEQAARAEAEARTAHLGAPGQPGAGPLTPAEAAPGEPTVKMQFARTVTLTLPGYRMVRFAEGICDVPASLADHQYLADSGATRV